MSESIDLTKSDQYILTIRVHTDGFSFFFYHTEKKDFHCTTYNVNPAISLTANLRNAIKEHDFLSMHYKHVIVMLDNSPTTFIPFELFEEEQATPQYLYNFPELKDRVVLYSILKKTPTVILFSIEKSTFQLLNEQFGELTFSPTLSSIIEYCSEKSRSDDHINMYLYLRKRVMDILCLNRNKILFCNTFAASDNNDRMYYALYVWKQMNMSQEKDKLFLFGNKEGNELKTVMDKYVRQISILNFQVDNIPLDIQTFFLCEL